MTPAELVNLIIHKFGGNRVTFISIERNDRNSFHVDFTLGANKYHSNFPYGKMNHIFVWKDTGDGLVRDNYSHWVECVLNGMVRNEEGELAKQ